MGDADPHLRAKYLEHFREAIPALTSREGLESLRALAHTWLAPHAEFDSAMTLLAARADELGVALGP